MTNAHQRTKAPEQVRRRVLTAAAERAIAGGLADVTIQAVATAAGVTKGGLLHHFASKQVLLDAVFADLIDAYEKEIEARMAGQPATYGIFTRAYIETTLADITDATHRARATLCVLAISDPCMRKLWAARMTQLIQTHSDTDSATPLAAARFAADGYWLAEMIGHDPQDPECMRRWLMAQTERE